MSVDHWFFGPHQYGRAGYEVEKENRRLALQRIAPIVVTPEELVQAIGRDGVESHQAYRVITSLLERAETEALSRTFGGIADATLHTDS